MGSLRALPAFALLALIACGKRSPSDDSSRAGSAVPAAVPAAPEGSNVAAVSGVAAAVPPVPRPDWPCRSDVRSKDQDGVVRTEVWTYVYGERSSCMLPVEVHVDGVVGCPSEIVIETAARKRSTEPLTYDAVGHLLEYADATYVWNGDRLVADGTNPYEVSGSTIRQRMDGREILRARAEAGQLTHLEYLDDQEIVTGVSTLTWSGQRLTGVETISLAIAGETRMTLHHDCARR